MTFNASTVFRSYISDVLDNTSAEDIGTDSFKAALYGTTPDTATAKNDTTAHNLYNGAGGQFVTANELTGGGATWTAGGVALSWSVATRKTDGSGFVMFDADDVAPGGTNTITAAFGALVYDTSVSNHGLSMNYFGGSQSVTAGTFTIVWNANGVFRVTV